MPEAFLPGFTVISSTEGTEAQTPNYHEASKRMRIHLNASTGDVDAYAATMSDDP